MARSSRESGHTSRDGDRHCVSARTMTVHTFFRFLCLFVVLALYFSRLYGWYLMCSDVLTVILTSNSDTEAIL